jgi:hypothetical protein
MDLSGNIFVAAAGFCLFIERSERVSGLAKPQSRAPVLLFLKTKEEMLCS